MKKLFLVFALLLLFAVPVRADTIVYGLSGWSSMADCSGVIANSVGCWDNDNFVLYIGNGTSAQAISSTGDVTGVGDCADGACYDGSSDGGTYVRLYDGTSAYVSITAGVRTLTLVPSNTNAENMTLTFGDNNNVVTINSGTGATFTITPALTVTGGITLGNTLGMGTNDITMTWAPTGSTIADNASVKTALQSLETALELKAATGQVFYFGTTQVAINRTTGNMDVAGIRTTHPASTTSAGTAPIKLTTGTVMTTPEAGAFEFTSDTLYFSITTGPARKTIAFTDSNITGTAANVSGTPALPNGTTATTQSQADNSTKLATTAYVDTGLGGKQASGSYQAADADLTAIAALACTENQIIKRNGSSAWVCGADDNSGSATAINDIGDAAGDGTINQTGYKQIFTSTLNAAGAVWSMTNTTADLTSDVSFIDFKYTDDGDANGFFMRGYDNTSDLKWSIGSDGAASFGSLTGTAISDSTSTTSSTVAGSVTGVKAAYDLAALAIPKAGGTFSGNVALDDGVTDSPSLTFQDSDDETAIFVKKQGVAGSGYLQLTTLADDGLQIITGNLRVGAGSPGQSINGTDSYMTGILEVDGMIYADGGITGTLTGTATGLAAQYIDWSKSSGADSIANKPTIVTNNASTSGGPRLVALDNASPATIRDLTLSTRFSLTGTTSPALDLVNPPVIDGSAHFHLSAAQMGPGCHVTNFGQSGEVDGLLPPAADSLSCLFDVGDAEAAHWGVTSNTGDDIYLIAADGTLSQCGDQTSVVMTAAQVGQTFAVWSFKTAANAWDWKAKAISIGTSTFACHTAISAP